MDSEEQLAPPGDRRRMPRSELILPYVVQSDDDGLAPLGQGHDEQHSTRISSWLEDRAAWMRRAWMSGSGAPQSAVVSRASTCVEQILSTLLHRKFNHQARGKAKPLLQQLRLDISNAVSANKPLVFFLLLNGGYRASPLPRSPGLIFLPDQTELMLLFQITRLHEEITKTYPPGMEFVIVVNNGVSRWVNDIPCSATEAYSAALRRMIRQVGAHDRVRVLVQSELPGYSDSAQLAIDLEAPSITTPEHRTVERFLGRACDEIEARHRFALYPIAEAAWSETLRPLAKAQDAIILRQVAHPSSLSFRPFPGGATRSQNGTLGFFERGAELLPTLITTASYDRNSIRHVPIHLAYASKPRLTCAPETSDA